MTRRIVPLTPDRLAALPGPCGACVAWECSPADAARLVDDRETRVAEKAAWVSSLLREWGSCGRVVVVDDQPVGYVVHAPPALVPGSHRFPTSPVGADAVLLTNVWVHPSYAGQGLGRQLVQHVARDLVDRGGYRAVEAFASARPVPASCVPPADFLARVGFATQREHPAWPRMRMDLRSTLRWREEVEAALDRLRGVVPPVPVRPLTPGRPVRRGTRRAP